MSCAETNIFADIRSVGLGGIRQIAQIRIHTQIQGIDRIYIFHGFFHGIHEFRLHGLKAQDNASAGSHLYGLFEIFPKEPAGLLGALLVIHIVAGKLDDPDSQIICQGNGFLHNLHAPGPGRLAGASQRILAVAA